jgi:hypothetical protein
MYSVPHTIYRLPLAVAVTGHRDIAPNDEARLRALILKRLETLRCKYTSTPLLALSGLAEGADMVFAEAALELGIELVAVLPGSAEIFAKDFERPVHAERNPKDLKQRFEALCARCTDVVVVGNGRLAEDPRRYTFVGAYLVRRCHILFALWDGGEAKPESGTGQVVGLALDGVPNRYRESASHALDAPDSITVHHLLTPRQGSTVQDAFTWRVIEPTPWDSSPCQATPGTPLIALNAWNKAVLRFSEKHIDAINQARSYLALPEEALNSAEKRILGTYAVADAMAQVLQKRSRRILDIIYGISLIMLVSFAVHSNLSANRVLYILYYAAFIVGGSLYAYEKITRQHGLFVDSRGLAEGLRVQLFFRLSGVRSLTADLYLRKQRTEITWIRQAMRVLDVGSKRQEPLFEQVRDSWIRAQGAYYAKAKNRDAHKLLWYGQVADWGFIGGLAIGTFGLIFELCDATMYDSLLVHWIFLLMGLMPGVAALALSHSFRRGLEQHVREYGKNVAMFCRASTVIETQDLVQKPFAFRTLVLELGKEALAENAQWVLQHRELPPSLPSK